MALFYNNNIIIPLDTQIQSQEYEHSSVILDSDNHICSGLLVTCVFNDDSPNSACVVVIHKKSLLLDSTHGLPLTIKVHLFSRSIISNEASGCLVNTTTNEYHVAVFSYINGTIGKQLQS